MVRFLRPCAAAGTVIIARDFSLFFSRREKRERSNSFVARRAGKKKRASLRLLIISQICDCGRVLSNDERKAKNKRGKETRKDTRRGIIYRVIPIA